LIAIHEGREINLFWIPVHKDIPGNESVDFLAKKATTIPGYPLSKFLIRTFIQKLENLSVNNFLLILRSLLVWLVLCTLLFFRIYVLLTYGTLTSLLIEKKLFLLIESVVIITISTTVYFGKTWWLLWLVYGDSKQDINHIILFCSIIIPKSSHLRTFLVKSYSYHLIDILPILNNPCLKLIRLLMAYLKANDILIWFSRLFPLLFLLPPVQHLFTRASGWNPLSIKHMRRLTVREHDRGYWSELSLLITFPLMAPYGVSAHTTFLWKDGGIAYA